MGPIGCGEYGKTKTEPETHLEEINDGTSVQAGLLVDGAQDGGFLSLGWVQGGSQIEFKTFSDLVLEFDLGTEQVGGSPCLFGWVSCQWTVRFIYLPSFAVRCSALRCAALLCSALLYSTLARINMMPSFIPIPGLRVIYDATRS